MDKISENIKWDSLIGYKQTEQKEWTREGIILKWRNLIKAGIEIYKHTGFIDPILVAFCKNRDSMILPIPDFGLNNEAIGTLMKEALVKQNALSIFMSCQGQFVTPNNLKGPNNFKAILFLGQLRSHYGIETFISTAKIHKDKLEDPSELKFDNSAAGLLCDFLPAIGPQIRDINILRVKYE